MPICDCQSLTGVSSNTRRIGVGAREQDHPGGMIDNRPAFQRRESRGTASSPEGTAETNHVSRPFGTHPLPTSHPALKRRAIVVCPSGTYLPARRARLWTCVTLMCCLAVHSIRA